MLCGEVIALARHNAALGLDDELVARNTDNRLAEDLFAGPAAVDIGVVEEICAQIQRGFDIGFRLFCIQAVQAHTAQRQRGHIQSAAAKRNHLHQTASLF